MRKLARLGKPKKPSFLQLVLFLIFHRNDIHLISKRLNRLPFVISLAKINMQIVHKMEFIILTKFHFHHTLKHTKSQNICPITNHKTEFSLVERISMQRLLIRK